MYIFCFFPWQLNLIKCVNFSAQNFYRNNGGNGVLASFRDMQTSITTITKKSGMITAADLGDPGNIDVCSSLLFILVVESNFYNIFSRKL